MFEVEKGNAGLKWVKIHRAPNETLLSSAGEDIRQTFSKNKINENSWNQKLPKSFRKVSKTRQKIQRYKYQKEAIDNAIILMFYSHWENIKVYLESIHTSTTELFGKIVND